MIKWFRTFLILALTFALSSVIASAQVDGGELEDGEEIDVEVEDEDELVFTYDADEGAVISIIVQSENDLDLKARILDPDGDVYAEDDDSGAGLTPAFVRLVLEDEGVYTLEITQYSDEDMDDEIEVTLFETELLDLGDGAQTTELGDDFEIDRMVFEAEEDEVYAIFITPGDSLESSLFIDVLEEGETFASTRVTIRGVDRAGFLYEANDDGIVTLEFEYFGFSDSVEFEVEVVQQ